MNSRKLITDKGLINLNCIYVNIKKLLSEMIHLGTPLIHVLCKRQVCYETLHVPSGLSGDTDLQNDQKE